MSGGRYAFYVDRSTYVREQLLETVDGVEDGKDVSTSTLKVYLRAHVAPSSALVLNQLLTKVEISGGDYPDTNPATSGVEGYVRFTAAYPRLVFRLVLVDEAVADTETVSEYREIVRGEWVDAVKDSPQS